MSPTPTVYRFTSSGKNPGPWKSSSLIHGQCLSRLLVSICERERLMLLILWPEHLDSNTTFSKRRGERIPQSIPERTVVMLMRGSGEYPVSGWGIHNVEAVSL